LIVEGLWRPGRNGMVEVREKCWYSVPIQTRRLNGFLTTLESKAGVIVRRTVFPEETVSMIVDLYRWWQEPWVDHKSHDVVYTIKPLNSDGHRMVSLSPREITLVERVALQLPGLAEKARYVSKRWPTVRAMMKATEEDWADLLWTDKNGAEKRLGEAWAAKIVQALNAKT
jgi:ERCC4-type nuclease